MNAVNILASLGFIGAKYHGEQKGKLIVSVKTDKGWTYEKFGKDTLEDEITAWARDKEPAQW